MAFPQPAAPHSYWMHLSTAVSSSTSAWICSVLAAEFSQLLVLHGPVPQVRGLWVKVLQCLALAVSAVQCDPVGFLGVCSVS